MNNITIGMDLGDRNHVVCVLDEAGETLVSCSVENDKKSLDAFFCTYKRATVAIEAGTHSPWISRHLSAMGCNVLIGNPRKLRVILDSYDKSDN